MKYFARPTGAIVSVAASPHLLLADSERPTPGLGRLGPGWPLKLLILGFPLWWALSISSFAFLIAAAAMAADMFRRGRIRLPAGFGVWVLFLLWVLAGVFLLWAQAPGTVEGGGIGRFVGYGLRLLWYLAISVAIFSDWPEIFNNDGALTLCYPGQVVASR